MSKWSTILTCLGAAGVVGTSILSANAKTKADSILERAENDKGEKLSKLEAFKAVAPTYIPAVVMGAATIACIFGANVLNARQQATLASAYAILDKSYKEYQKKVRDIHGEEADREVKEAIVKENFDDQVNDSSEEEALFFDFYAAQYFTAKMEDVVQKVTMDDGLECYIISTPYMVDNKPID